MKQGTRSRAGNGYSEGGVGDLRIRKGVKQLPWRVDEWADHRSNIGLMDRKKDICGPAFRKNKYRAWTKWWCLLVCILFV